MSWIKFILMIPVGFIILAYTFIYYLFCAFVFIMIIATTVVVLLAWKIPYLIGIGEGNPLFFPCFFVNIAIILGFLLYLIILVVK